MSSPHLDVETQEDDTSYKSVQLSPPTFSHRSLNGKEMARDSSGPGGSCLSRSEHITFPIDPGVHAQAFQQQLLQLKRQQQLQQQILLQHYQSQQQQLAEQHELQLRQHLKEFREQQKALEEQRERREKERLEKLEKLAALKKKDKHEQSAIASSEVKQRLQGFLLNKKQREAANGTGPPFRQNWGEPPPPHPYHLNHLVPVGYDDDFPLRKTASEPNLLKVRLKQRVIERRASPLAYHRQRNLRQQTLRNKALANSSSSSGGGGSGDTGGTSPSLISGLRTSPSASGNTPIREEPESPPYGQLTNQSGQGSLSDLALYSSPSMPNISLGRPPSSSSSGIADTGGGAGGGGQSSMQMSPLQQQPIGEDEVRVAAFNARLGGSLTGRMLSNTLPFYPAISAMESESSPADANHIDGISGGITDAQAAQARLHKAGHRPLGRTQSAPLPLGHPMLQGTTADTRHNLLKQQIRATVLTRAGRHLEEAVDENAEVIDLTRNGSGGSLSSTTTTTTTISNGSGHLPHSSPPLSSSASTCELSRQQKDRQQFLQQQRDLMMRHTMQIAEGSAFTPRVPSTAHMPRPLSRALSSPLVALGGSSDIPLPLVTSATSASISPHSAATVTACGTGLAFDSLMLKHACVCGDNAAHPEHGGRLQSVWARLVETGLAARCDRLRARKATIDELQSVHSEAHALLFGTNPLNRQKLDMSKLSTLPIKSFVRLPCGGVGVDSDTTWNELHTAPAARMAVGCVVDLAFKAASGDIRNGFAVVRPPGHHAEPSQAMGFCFFNSVGIAAKLLLQRLHLTKIFILDWDVHHGNGTQQMFYDEPRVLYMSLHRHDNGNFFPGTGGPAECGTGDGVGFNVNIAFSGGLQPPMGDAEYLAAFRTIVMPIAEEFDPEIVLVSAGFDAAAGHAPPLGGYLLSAACFGHMTQQLMSLANGKVVLALEGGYDLPSICDAAQECVRALLGDPISPISETELTRAPCDSAIDTLRKTIAVQRSHWPVLERLAYTLLEPYATATGTTPSPAADAHDERSVSTRMAELSMHAAAQAAAAAAAAHAARYVIDRSPCEESTEPEAMDEDEGK